MAFELDSIFHNQTMVKILLSQGHLLHANKICQKLLAKDPANKVLQELYENTKTNFLKNYAGVAAKTTQSEQPEQPQQAEQLEQSDEQKGQVEPLEEPQQVKQEIRNEIIEVIALEQTGPSLETGFEKENSSLENIAFVQMKVRTLETFLQKIQERRL